MRHEHAGRPKNSYKYYNPNTGKRISAVEYHQMMRKISRDSKTELEVNKKNLLSGKDDKTLYMLIEFRKYIDKQIKELI